MSFTQPRKEVIVEKSHNRWYIPVMRTKDQFILWAGEGDVRYFYLEKLPDCIKVLLAILMNKPEAQALNDVTTVSSFNLQPPEGADPELGWQISKHYFVVSLSDAQLVEVRKGQAP